MILLLFVSFILVTCYFSVYCVVQSGNVYLLFCVIDVDECSDPSVCPAPISCINTVGSYKCDCGIGFMFNAEDQRCVGKAATETHIHLKERCRQFLELP